MAFKQADVYKDFNSLAPRGANLARTGFAPCHVYFNSLAPRGANRNPLLRHNAGIQFQLTRPAWGEPQAAAMFEEA